MDWLGLTCAAALKDIWENEQLPDQAGHVTSVELAWLLLMPVRASADTSLCSVSASFGAAFLVSSICVWATVLPMLTLAAGTCVCQCQV